MKLYIYDHCPFCLRVRMTAGLKKLAIEEIVLQNDDEDTPIRLVGKKVLPILVKEDGTAMGESLEIVKYLDSHYGEKRFNEAIRPEIARWLTDVGSYYHLLTMPRYTKMGLAEYGSQAAIDYFEKKKIETFGSFEALLADTPAYLERLAPDLATLDRLIQSPSALNGELSMEDVQVFPILRQLTCVKGIQFPANVAEYVAKMAELSGVSLFSDKAV